MRKIALFLAMTSLGACSMAPHYVRPELPVPPSWPVGDAYLAQSEAALPSISYRDIFRDSRLQTLVEQALVNNRDLRVAAANIASARAQYHVQRAELLPEVDATGGYRFSDPGGGNSGGTNINRGSGSFTADIGINAFEIDLFGRVRSLSTSSEIIMCSAPGIGSGRVFEPVAMTMVFASNVWSPTRTVVGPANRASPRMMSMPRRSMARVRSAGTSLIRSFSRSISAAQSSDGAPTAM